MKKMIFLIVTAFLLVAAMMIFTQNFSPPSFPDGVNPAASAEEPAAEQPAADTGGEPESPPAQTEQPQAEEAGAGSASPDPVGADHSAGTGTEAGQEPDQTPEPEPPPPQQQPPAQPVVTPPASGEDLLTEAEQQKLKQQMLDLIESLKE